MATLLLQSAGAAIGGALGGPFGAILGRAAGAIAGNLIDRRLLSKDRIVHGPRLEQAQILASSDGAGMPRVYGRARVGGQIIWATRFEEVITRSTEGGGKGGRPAVTVEDYAYFANFAVGICEGPVTALGRIWADGVELDQTRHEIRFHDGGEDQPVDPLIEAKQGAGAAPAYRGTAYVVFEGFALESFGNRIPQLSFEIIRSVSRLDRTIRAITVIPGSTEFGYAPAPVRASETSGQTRIVNRNNLTRASDWLASIDELVALCPELETVALVVAWFGDDLRAGHCTIRPRVEFSSAGGEGWQVSGLARPAAGEVSRIDGSPAYGGTPADASVVAAIADLKARGLKVVLYPFVMMDIPPGNGLPDPHGGAEQAAYPWRGRITAFPGPGQASTADGTAAARDQVLAFAGAATPADFVVSGAVVSFSGGDDWGYRRMVLHYAHLAAAAGGVDGFLIGSELRGLTTLRDETDAFPFVDILCGLAGDARTVLGGATTITYGADWSEYFGHHPQDGSGDVYFHLDPLWADTAIDCVGIDNYMPLADWRAEGDPGDADARSQFDLAYLAANVAGGEGHDWYYASDADRRAGLRTPITDGLGEPWIWAFKDLKSWWQNAHHERIGGVRSPTPTAWVAQSKPIWLTELGCPAVTMGANQPNVFVDPKSSESRLPHFSSGARCDLAQNTSLLAHYDWWDTATDGLPAGRNPVSAVYGGPMVDTADIFPWAWDARPFPRFPADTALWTDGHNWHVGHWLNGRLGGCPLSELIEAIATDFGIALDRVRADGFLDGYVVAGPVSARAALEPLTALFDVAYVEDGGERRFEARAYAARAELAAADLAELPGRPVVARSRDQESELPRQMELRHAGVFSGYEPQMSYSRRLETASRRIVSLDMAAVLPASTAIGAMEARLRDAWVGRERLRLATTSRHLALSAGDRVRFTDAAIAGQWRIESVEDGLGHALALRAVVDPDTVAAPAPPVPLPVAPAPAHGAPLFHVMNLPVAPQTVVPHVHVALAASPWARRYAVMTAPDSDGFVRRAMVNRPAIIGTLVAPLAPGPRGRWDHCNRLNVALASGQLASLPEALVLNGANGAAVMTQTGEWEVLQFAAAELQADGSWLLSRLLRAQLGSDAAMADGAPAGAAFVLLDDAVSRVDLSALENGLTLNWRAGPAGDPVSADSYAALAHAHAAIALRPLSPVHLRGRRLGSGDIELAWIRRSRIDADDWEPPDVPLGESSERYRVDILRPDGSIARGLAVTVPEVTYGATEQVADFGAPPASLAVSVVQIAGNGAAGSPARADFTF